MHRRQSSRRAFTLVELIVVVGIVVTVAAIIFVAVQRIRDGAMRTSCINNLKQVALASKNYYDVNQKFPPGFSKNTQAGVLVYLLPFVEQPELAAQMPAALMKGTGGAWYSQFPGGGLGAGGPVSTRISSYECPAANLYSATFANGTVQNESLGGGGGVQQLTLRQMLGMDPNVKPTEAIKAQGQAIANNLDKIYYAAWSVQTLVFEISLFGVTQGRVDLALDGGTAAVQGGTSGFAGFLGYSDGATWTATGSFIVNSQKYDVNLNQPDLFITYDAIGAKVPVDKSKYVDSGGLLVPPGYSYDPASPVVSFSLFGITIGFSEQEITLIDGNIVFDFNASRVAPAFLGKACTTAPQNNPTFWAYYDRTYAATYKYTVGGAPPGFALNPNNPKDFTMGRTSYVGNSGMFGFNAGTPYSAGPFYPDSAVTFHDIADGESNTIAFGEALGGSELMSRDYALTWMGAGIMPSYWDCQTPSTWYTFGSPHVSGVNFAFCDGSVRTLTKVAASSADTVGAPPSKINTPRWTVFQQLAGIQDGGSPDVTSIQN